MNYSKAIKKSMEGNRIRNVLMDKGEYIEYIKDEERFIWWDSHHTGYLSYPQDLLNQDYLKWILAKWEVCNDIEAC